MKRIICVLLTAVLAFGVLTSCGEDKTGTIKEVNVDTYTDRVVDAAKEEAAKNDSVEKPVVTKEEFRTYVSTKITYNENELIDITSNIDTKEVNGAKMSFYSSQETREADLEKFFYRIEMLLRKSDPSVTDEQVNEAIGKFKEAVPDDPSAEGYTGLCSYTHMLNGISYFVYYNFTEDTAELELIIT